MLSMLSNPRLSVGGYREELAAGSVTIFLLVAFYLGHFRLAFYVLLLQALIVALAAYRRWPSVVHLGSFAWACWVTVYLPVALQSWPFTLLMPLLIYGPISVAWRRCGFAGPLLGGRRFTRRQLAAALGVGAFSVLGLAGWLLVARPSLQMQAQLLPPNVLQIFPLVILGFALLNSILEEAIFRGVVMGSLLHALPTPAIVVMTQAVVFACAHVVGGIPNGASGFVLALLYGVLLGVLRIRFDTMLAAWLAHFVTDTFIGSALVVYYMLETA
jgi:membrane protease YdiL (CAAX protease family)